MNNQPTKIADFVAFRENDFPVHIDLEDGIIVDDPTVLIGIDGEMQQDIVIPVEYTLSTLDFALTKEQLAILPVGKKKVTVYIKFADAYVFTAPLRVTMDGSVPEPRATEIKAPSIGTIRTSIYSDIAAVKLAEEYSIQAKQDSVEAIEAAARAEVAAAQSINKINKANLNNFQNGTDLDLDSVVITDKLKSGIFVYDPSDTTSPADNVMTLVRGSRRYKREYSSYVDVRWFGAKGNTDENGNGVDDTDSIQAAIDYLNPSSHLVWHFDQSIKSGGTVYFPAGRYKITKTLILTNSIKLLGNTGQSNASQKYKNTGTASIIVGRLIERSFMIQTQSWRKADFDNNPITPGRVAWNEPTHWKQFDGKNITVTSGATLENLVIVDQSTARWGCVRFCSAAYCTIRNCEIADSFLGVMMDCSLHNKIVDSHIDARIMGVVIGESAVSIDLNHVYINGNNKTTLNEQNIPIPAYLDMDRYHPVNPIFGYNSGSKTVCLFVHGVNGLTLNNITFESWDIGLFNKLGKIAGTRLYFEHIYDTAIVLTRGNLTFLSGEFVNTKNWYGIDEFARMTALETSSSYEPEGSAVYKPGFSIRNQGTNRIRVPSEFITQRDFRTNERFTTTAAALNAMPNNSVTQTNPDAGAPSYGNVFTFGGPEDSSTQAQIFISGVPMFPGMWIRGRENYGEYHPFVRVFTHNGGTLQGSIYFHSFVGTNGFERGTADGASYAGANLNLRLHYGLAIVDNLGLITGFLNARTGTLDFKGGYSVNGVKLQADASQNAAQAAPAAYSQSQVQAMLDEMRDMKAKLISAGLMKPNP